MTALPAALTLPYHQDPGHGWIAIPRSLARRLLGPDFHRISPFSYQQASTGLLFLEEDCDAALLLAACRRQAIALTLTDVHCNSDSPIRHLPSFSP